MKPEELKKILREHKKWLAGNGGKRADLQGADLRGARLQDADLHNTLIPIYCKWSSAVCNGNIKIGCITKSPEEWEQWLESDEEYETKRGTDEFKQIEAVIRAHIAYLKVLDK